MLFEGLSSSAALTVAHFADIDSFYATEIVGGARSIPLRLKDFSAARASLLLPSCQLVLQKSFARILDTGFQSSGAGVVVPIGKDSEAVLNGVEVDFQTLMFLRGKAAGRSTEPRGNLYAIINFDSPMLDRGWPDADNQVYLFRAKHAAIDQLGRTIRDLLGCASACPMHMDLHGIAKAMEESLVSALDATFAGLDPLAGCSRLSLNRYAQIVGRVDEILTMNPAVAHYSEGLARDCGVSVRTLQTAIMTIRGMSIHHYLRIRRLWSVRQRLTAGGPGLTVRACALANGFWHLGEFAGAYRAAFGETAAETLARALH